MLYKNEPEDLGQGSVGRGVGLISWNINLPHREEEDVATNNRGSREAMGRQLLSLFEVSVSVQD